jgi:ABC-type multidrug transport system fused ATPase/permease subunit
MTNELKIQITAEVNKFKKNVNDAKEKIKDFATTGVKDVDKLKEQLEKAGEGAKNFLKTAAGAMAGAATALVGLSAATKDYRVAQAKLNTAFEAAGSTAGVAKDVYNDLYRTLGDTDKAVEAANHLAKLSTNQKDLKTWTEICQGVYATFGDSLPIEGLTEAANETARVGQVTGPLADALNWAGISEDKFNEQLLECATTQEREALIRETLNGLYQDASKGYEENAKGILAQNEAQAKLTENMAKIGETMEPILAQLTTLASEILAQIAPHIQMFADKYGPVIKDTLLAIGEAVGKVISWIVDNWEIIKLVATIIGAIAIALTAMTTALSIYNTVMAIATVVSAPIILIIMAIVAAIALCIVYWDEIWAVIKKVAAAIAEAVKAMADKVSKLFSAMGDAISSRVEAVKTIALNVFTAIKDGITSRINAIKTTATTIFNGIKSAITKPIETAKSVIFGIIDKIKAAFNFKVELPKIKLPHFSVKPKGWKIGDLLDGSIPSLGIEWYAKGGVFERPSAFGMNGNRLMVGGEAGAEAIVPLEKNTKWLDKIANKLAGATDRAVVLNVDGKTFAQTSINTINELTKQTGSLKLNIM